MARKTRKRVRTVRQRYIEAQCEVCHEWKEVTPNQVDRFRTCSAACRMRLSYYGGDAAEARRAYLKAEARAKAAKTS